MKLYGLEEHMATVDVVKAWKRADPQLTEPMMKWSLSSDLPPALLDVDDGRVAVMDDAGIDAAVLSLTTRGLQTIRGARHSRAVGRRRRTVTCARALVVEPEESE